MVYKAKEDEPKSALAEEGEEEQACGICLQIFENGENLKVLPCKEEVPGSS